MKKFSVFLCAILLVFGVARISSATLFDRGEMFFDDQTGLYWYDPIYWAVNIAIDPWGSVQDLIDKVEIFLKNNPSWRWPSTQEFANLYESLQWSITVTDLEQIIGTHTSLTSDGRYFWGGVSPYYAPRIAMSHHDHGYGLLPDAENIFIESWVDALPLQNLPFHYQGWEVAGAWIVSDSEPVPNPAKAMPWIPLLLLDD